MSLQVEKLEKNMAKLTIEVSAEEFDAAIEKAYQKNKGKINIQGFRKGKAPRQMIEKMYGVGVFYEDAANIIIPDAYSKEVSECKEVEIVSQPEIDVVQIEKGKPFIFTAVVALKPEVELGEYKGIKVEVAAPEVKDEDVEAELKKAQEEQARTIPVEDRPVADGDITTIDFEGFVDGVAFEGGKGTDYALTIGSHSFIDTFEEQLIGKNIGEEVEVNVTFPEEYHAEELKGKPALFKVVIKEIKTKELPELDDDFAQDVSDFDTLAEYKEDIKNKLLEKAEKAAKNEKEEKLIDAIIADSKMDIPEAMIETQQDQMIREFANRIASQGLSFDQYMQFTGMTMDMMKEQMKPQALKRIQVRLVLEAIAAKEAFEITEEDIEKELETMASMYQMDIAKLKEIVSDNEKEAMKKDIAVSKAAELIVAESK
ncbi:MAG: trigger factor [Lachnospiraceae bacterium]|nr:trigger factor [Lachnospiraceae bacterium]